MLKNEAVEIVKAIILACSATLDESARKMLQEADERQATTYRRLVGLAMGGLYTDVLMPIYRAYPELEPPEIREARLAPREQVRISSELRDSVLGATTEVRTKLAELVARVRALSGDSAAAEFETSLESSLEAVEQIEAFIGRVSA